MEPPPPAVPTPLSIAAVLLSCRDPAALAAFYRQHFGVPLRPVDVPGLDPHWACDIGHVYLSLWPANGPDAALDAPGRAGVALQVRDVQADHRRLVAAGVTVLFPPRSTPVGLLARYRDPEGHVVEIMQPPRHTAAAPRAPGSRPA